MKTLFNKSGSNGSTELKILLGFLDVDIKYANIKSDILSATKEVKALVGKEVFDKAFDAYNSEDTTQEELLYYMRFPIAINAYRMYAPNADLAHTPNGRKMRVADYEKNAFEWMIDRDNEALERKYYRALDDLLHYLEEAELPEWKASDEYKNLQKSIFKTTEEFNYHFPIESRLLLMRMLPGINQCLNHEIKPRLGNQLNDLFAEGVPSDKEELIFNVKQACAYYALAWALPRFSVRIFPEGVLQQYVTNTATTRGKKVPELNEIAWAKQSFEEDYKKAIARIETILRSDLDQAKEVSLNDLISGSNFLST